jgi:hypothetical protein
VAPDGADFSFLVGLRDQLVTTGGGGQETKQTPRPGRPSTTLGRRPPRPAPRLSLRPAAGRQAGRKKKFLVFYDQLISGRPPLGGDWSWDRSWDWFQGTG